MVFFFFAEVEFGYVSWECSSPLSPQCYFGCDCSPSSLRTSSQQVAWRRHFVLKSVFVVLLFNWVLYKILPLSNHVVLPLDSYSHTRVDVE